MGQISAILKVVMMHFHIASNYKRAFVSVISTGIITNVIYQGGYNHSTIGIIWGYY